MVIDIDSFLEKYDHNEDKKDIKKDEKEDINLEFQKDIEEKIHKTQEKGKNSEFKILEKIYTEVKRFDEDLPNKFLGIETKGNEALRDLGDKYSKNFLINIKRNVNILNNSISINLKLFDEKINTNNFLEILKSFEELIKCYELYPKEFLKEKIKISKEIKSREIIVNKKIAEYKKTKLKQIKTDINKVLIELNNSLKPSNIKEIEYEIDKIQQILKTIPKLFLTDLTDEKIIIAKILIKAESYLENEYVKEFNEKEKIIFELFDSFHNSYLNKDLERGLMIYDEILIEFKNLPEVFLERKIEIYIKINSLYSLLNELLIKNSVSTFLESYNSGKTLEDINNYLKYIKDTGKINVENINILKQKLKSIPQKFEPEKNQIEKEIVSLINIKKNNEIMNKDEFEIKSQTSKFKRTKIQNPENKNVFPKQAESKLNILNIKTHTINKEILQEINLHYERLKKSENPNELKLLYKKIMFYLNMTQIGTKNRKEIIQKINKILSNKKLN